MIVDVVMPKMGESITEGTILEWYKKIGDSIEKDETLLEIGTDKVDSEIPSPESGTVCDILANPNDVLMWAMSSQGLIPMVAVINQLRK